MMAMTQPLSILMIEDDEGHARLIEKNIRQAGVNNAIVHLRDGTSTLEYLFGTGRAARRENRTPVLILLDLNLPDMAGMEILRRVKTDDLLKRTPVFVVTTTDERAEIDRCYELGCNVYITKPLIYQHFAQAIRHLGLFLSVIQIPEQVSA